MKLLAAAPLSALLLGLSVPAAAQTSSSYACQWISEVTPQAVIRFTSTNGTGLYRGMLTYSGKRLMPFQDVQSQGYGSHWWNTGEQDGPSGQVVVFAGEHVVRGTPGFWQGQRPSGAQRVLLVGLGSAMYYGSDPSWRDDPLLLTAAEGFWRASPGCRALL